MDTRRHGVHHLSAYRIFCLVVLFILAFLFLFPLYWIVTGAFKTAQEVNSVTPVWWPQQWTMANFQKLMSRQSAPLWEIHLPFSSGLTKDGSSLILSAGPVLPAAVRWLINTVFMSLMAMILTCVTATMAGYALAKKRFAGQTILFALIVAAMALPKQVITIPLIREMSSLKLYNTIWAVIFPTVGWPFGVFLMRQFSETVPQEMLEAARIDGASDYFMQLIMLSSTNNLTISLGIAKLQAENSTDFGLIMAGAALASVPILIVFLVFQKYFTQGIAMGAVKG